METINAIGYVGAFDKSVILIRLPTVLSKHTHKMFFPDVSYILTEMLNVYTLGAGLLKKEKNQVKERKLYKASLVSLVALMNGQN